MLPSGLWIVDPFLAWRDRVRADVDARLGVALDYTGTPEGAVVDATADALWTIDQGGQSIVDGLSPVTAADEQLDLLGEQVRIRRRPATPTRYEVTADLAVGASAVPIPAGTLFAFAGAGGETRWRSVAAVTVDDGDPLVVESVTPGAIFLPPSVVSLRVVTPVSGLDGVDRDPTDPAQLGRDRESPAAYRLRLQRLASADGGTVPGWLRRIGAVEFVRAASITITSPGVVLVRVVPGALTPEQVATLAQAIFDGAPPVTYDPFGTVTQVTGTATDPFGGTHPVVWYEGVEEPVDAASQVVLASGYTLGDGGPLDVLPSMIEAYQALFATLAPGVTVRWSDYYCALAAVPGVARVLTGSSVTWLGSSGQQVDVSPTTATDLLVPRTLTVTT